MQVKQLTNIINTRRNVAQNDATYWSQMQKTGRLKKVGDRNVCLGLAYVVRWI